MEKFKIFIKKIADVIIGVEKEYSNQPNSGNLKKQKVISILSNLITIPLIPNTLKLKIFDLSIDIIVFFFNKYNLFYKS